MELIPVYALTEPTTLDPVTIVDEIKATTYLPFGSDNKFPNDLAELYRHSKIHRATLNNKTSYYTGKDYISEYQEIIDIVNQNSTSLRDESNKIILDYNLTGNGWFEIVTDNKSFVYIYHVDSTNVRLSKDKKSALIYPDWRNDTIPKENYLQTLPLYPVLLRDKSIYRSIFHIKSYEPEFKNYGVPEYIAGREDMAIDYKTSKYNLSKIVNFFGGNKIVFFPAKSDPAAKEFIAELKANHIGEGKNGKTMYQPYQSGTDINRAIDKVQVVDVGGDDKGGWVEISQQAQNDIIMAHNWYRSLMSTGDNTGFNTNMVYQEYQAALPQITGFQDMLINIYSRVFDDILNIDLDLQITNKPPVDVEVKEEDLQFLWEMRRDKGMEFNADDPTQQITVGEWKAKIKTI